jgi:hypothetical protein
VLNGGSIINSLSALLLFLSDDSDISKDDQVGVFSFTFHCIIGSFHSEIQLFLLEKKEKEKRRIVCAKLRIHCVSLQPSPCLEE